MRRLVRKLLVLAVLVASLGVFGGAKSAAIPCCSSCLNICDICETNPSYCTRCNNCLKNCNGGC